MQVVLCNQECVNGECKPLEELEGYSVIGKTDTEDSALDVDVRDGTGGKEGLDAIEKIATPLGGALKSVLGAQAGGGAKDKSQTGELKSLLSEFGDAYAALVAHRLLELEARVERLSRRLPPREPPPSVGGRTRKPPSE